MKVTYVLPGVRKYWCKISLRQGGHSVWVQKKFVFFGVSSQKGHSKIENTILMPELVIFMLKLT